MTQASRGMTTNDGLQMCFGACLPRGSQRHYGPVPNMRHSRGSTSFCSETPTRTGRARSSGGREFLAFGMLAASMGFSR
jgi:hypothetical protein